MLALIYPFNLRIIRPCSLAPLPDRHPVSRHKILSAARQGLQGTKKAVRSSFMDERMAFFAGRSRSDFSGHREPILFRTGCFRPDLAQREINKMHR